jgi:hypothetical protein
MGELLHGQLKDYQPRLKNRFYVEFTGGISLNGLYVLSASRPTFKIPHNITLLGNQPSVQPEYPSIRMRLLEDVKLTVTQALLPLVRPGALETLIHYRYITVDGTGEALETWNVTAKIDWVDFGGGDYADDGVAGIILYLTPTRATWRQGGPETQTEPLSPQPE